MAPRIGVDEAGKGDYFGYLVVAAVYVDDNTGTKLKDLGVKDSKMLPDLTIQKLSKEIKCPHEIVKISPEKYNELYKKFKSLNKLLAWAHARAIENLLKKTKPEFVVTDKFADAHVLRKALFKNGKKIKVVQRIHAEDDIAVAAASVLARNEFLKTLRRLSLDVGYNLPKGSTHVKEAAKILIKQHGVKILDYVAKKHFKITKQILGK
jgi:ribonuclease HIII